ncbi:MAG: competence/damage-inducible protein A [Lachnospiraceae bacterium]|nr:competence/damage-inducible protein A [Lachnospiraceae bacterium]
MTAELISVGTEILLGNIVNTNAAYLSEKMAGLGISVYFETTVGDNEERLTMALKSALSRSDILVLSGGLGPTADDITKETAAKVLDLPLYLDENVKSSIEDFFEKRMIHKITENNWKQAMVPEGAQILFNPNGTAPGLILKSKEGDKTVILLPGPPGELKPLFEEQVVPYLEKMTDGVIYSRTIKTFGIGESMLEDAISDMLKNQTNPTIAPYAKTGEVHLRVTAKASDIQEAKKLIQPICDEVSKRFGKNIYSMDENETLEESIIKILQNREWKLVTAESCTGGLLAGRIVGVPGVSDVFGRGFITYSNRAKRKILEVNKKTLEEFGAVSSQTAKEMAVGAAIAAQAEVAVSVTGIAGPGGGTEEKPVGLVYIGCHIKEKNYVKKCMFSGNRQKIRESSVANALGFLRQCLIEYDELA